MWLLRQGDMASSGGLQSGWRQGVRVFIHPPHQILCTCSLVNFVYTPVNILCTNPFSDLSRREGVEANFDPRFLALLEGSYRQLSVSTFILIVHSFRPTNSPRHTKKLLFFRTKSNSSLLNPFFHSSH